MNTAKLVELIERASKDADIVGMRRRLQDLRTHLTQTGAPLGDDVAVRLLEAMCETSSFQQVPGSLGKDPHDLIEQIERNARTAVQNPQHAAQLRKAWDELNGLLTYASVRVDDGSVHKLMGALRNARTFDLLGKTADRLLARGYQDDGTVRRHYAQALIDSGNPTAAIAMLEGMVGSGTVSAKEQNQVQGLLGRAHKQIYVDHIDDANEPYAVRQLFAGHLITAIGHYGSAYDINQPGNNDWHGINLIALLWLAHEDGIAVPSGTAPAGTDAGPIARRLIDALEGLARSPDNQNHWLPASVGQAYVALGQYDKAAEFLGIFLRHPKTDTFALAGTVRQLEEVWRIKAGADGAGPILAVLKGALAGRAGGSITLSGEERARLAQAAHSDYGPQLETMVPDGRFTPLALLLRIVSRASAVARIRTPMMASHGTGFLLRGEDLCDKLEPGLYMLTNSHVISGLQASLEQGALAPKDAKIIFEAESLNGGSTIYGCESEIVWESPIGRHDATLVRLSAKTPHLTPLPLGNEQNRPQPADPNGKQKGTPVAVLGHPKDEPLSLSTLGSIEHSNGTIVDLGPRTSDSDDPVYMHYQTPTEGGNSGSPVFETDKWTVIGLHHAGFDKESGRNRLGGKSGANFANEGIYIGSIRKAINADMKSKRRWK